jgi:hypothetical protein
MRGQRYQINIPFSVEKYLETINDADKRGIIEKLEQLATASVSLNIKSLQDLPMHIVCGIGNIELYMKFMNQN